MIPLVVVGWRFSVLRPTGPGLSTTDDLKCKKISLCNAAASSSSGLRSALVPNVKATGELFVEGHLDVTNRLPRGLAGFDDGSLDVSLHENAYSTRQEQQ